MIHKPEWNLIDKSPVGVFFTDPHGDWSYVNERWCQITGLKFEQANNESWIAGVHPDDRERCQSEWEYCFSNWINYHSEYRYLSTDKKHDKKYVWVCAYAFPILSKSSEHRGFIGSIALINTADEKAGGSKKAQNTKRISISSIIQNKNIFFQHELLWNTLNTYSKDHIIITDADGVIIDINRAFPNSFKEDLIETNIINIASQPFQEVIQTAIKNAGKKGRASDFQIFTTTGERRNAWYSGRAMPLKNKDDGSIMGVIFFLTDVTDRILIEVENQQHQRELSHLSQLNSLDEVISGVAHEINQPLSAIRNYTNGCKRKIQNQDLSQQELLDIFEKISTQAKRAGEIIFKMRLLFQKSKLALESQSLNKVIQESINFLSPEILEKVSPINFELDPNLPDVKLDKIQIEQVIINLIHNSFDACEKTNAKPLIHIQTRAAGKDHIQILYKDEGPGIELNILDTLFHPFVSTKPNGMGMGLSICKSIINAHSGKITAQNNNEDNSRDNSLNNNVSNNPNNLNPSKNMNKGVTFEINLPNKQTEGVSS